MRSTLSFKNFLISISTTSLTLACSYGTNVISQDNVSSNSYMDYDVNMYALNKVVCDPLGADQPANIQAGLKAELYYLNSDQPRFKSLNDYFSQGVQSSKTLFFTTVNVPTRIFSDGFPSQTGSMITTDTGENLIEYFALRFNATLKLAADDQEGEYEMALLADDGARLLIRDEEGNFQTIVDNDGDHSTKMGCGAKIQMAKSTEKLVKLEYYQGPRNNIALIPMWRKIDANTQPEPLCGVQSNTLYFDFNNGSTPKQAYLDMLARGWKPIAANNWSLPVEAVFNPCVVEIKPIITDFKIVNNSEGVLNFSWNTDRDTTSQVLYKNLRTGEELITTSDNIVRRSHNIEVSGLSINDTYEFRAVSISKRFGKAVSDPITAFIK